MKQSQGRTGHSSTDLVHLAVMPAYTDRAFREQAGVRAGRYITTYLEQRALDGETLPFLPAELLDMRDPYLGLSIFAITAFHRLLFKVAVMTRTPAAAGPKELSDTQATLIVCDRHIEAYLPEIIEAMLEEAGVPPRWRPAASPPVPRIQ